MDFDQALAVMDAQFSAKPPRYGEWFVAGQVISDHYRRHPEKLRVYTTDARTGPMRDLPRTQDQLRYPSFEKSREWLAEQSRGVRLDETFSTVNPGEVVGGDLVQTLEGNLSNYFLSTDPKTGKAAVFRYRLPRADPGTVSRSNGTTAKTLDRSHYRKVARSMDLLRETTGSVLRGINSQNKAFWERQKG